MDRTEERSTARDGDSSVATTVAVTSVASRPWTSASRVARRLHGAPGGIVAWVVATAIGVALKIADTTTSQFFDTWGLPLTFAIAFGLYTAATLRSARPQWFAMARPNDPIDEVADAWEVRVRCHRCDKSYVAHEMDRDPTGGHEAICAACATGPAFHTAAHEESLKYHEAAPQPSPVA